MLRNNPLSYQVNVASTGTTGTTPVFNLPFTDLNAVTAGLVITTATAGTIDVYVQTQAPDGNFYDVYHYAQQSATTTAGSQVFGAFNAEDGQRAIGVVGSKTISANTLGVGPLSNTWRIAFTIATGPFAFSVNFYSPTEDKGGL